MSVLQLIRLRPDRIAFQRWGHKNRVLKPNVDDGYAWHALLLAALGEFAPRPFVVKYDRHMTELLAYTYSDTRQWLALAQPVEVINAVGLNVGVDARPMPTNWDCEQRLSFEVRVRPVVRCRQGRGNSKEIDVAVRAKRDDDSIDRESAYRIWLAKEFSKNGAARLKHVKMKQFRRSRVLRKGQVDANVRGKRPIRTVEGPDVVLQGSLLVDNPEAFNVLLARGVGRHRAFGFGCLLLAPPGVLG